MTITQLSCFRCLVEEGSVTKAARRLGVTQPAVSQQLQLLSEELGCELFVRQGNQIDMTSDGQFVYEKAKAVLMELEELPSELLTRKGQVSGTVRIGSAQVATKTVLGDSVHEMLKQYPDLSFSLLEVNSTRLPELIQKSRIDLGVGAMGRAVKGIRFEKLISGRLVLVCSRRDELASRKTISMRELMELDLIRHSRDSTSGIIDYGDYGEGDGFRIEARNTETILSYVRRDLGRALAVSYLIEWLQPADIVTIELEDVVEVPWGILSDSSRRLPKAAEVFVDNLTRKVTEMAQSFGNQDAAQAVP